MLQAMALSMMINLIYLLSVSVVAGVAKRFLWRAPQNGAKALSPNDPDFSAINTYTYDCVVHQPMSSSSVIASRIARETSRSRTHPTIQKTLCDTSGHRSHL